MMQHVSGREHGTELRYACTELVFNKEMPLLFIYACPFACPLITRMNLQVFVHAYH